MSDVKRVVDLLSDISTTAERKVLDTNPHFIPINLEILNITLSSVIVQNVEDIYDADQIEQAKALNPSEGWERYLAKDTVISFTELKSSIEKFIESKHQNKIHINGTNVTVNGISMETNSIFKNLPAVVYSGKEIVGALYSSYNSAYSGLFKDFLNKEIAKFINKAIYKDRNYRVGFDIGHVLGNSELAKTPFGQKLKKILTILDSLIDGSIKIDGVPQEYITGDNSKIQELKSKVNSIFTQLSSKSTYGPRIEAEIKKDFGLNDLLVRLNANIVIIQDRYENQAIYANLIESPLGRQLIALIKEVNFSNNLVEQIAENISFSIAGKNIRVSKKSLPIKKQLPNKTKKSKVITKAEQNISIKNIPKYKTAPILITSLASLQRLLDAQLVQQVRQNMGGGSRRDILNLRTGRFAESVKVERLSESREGMITAFYSYMKNPYATFSAGGRQETPKTRDPKLLIAKSIREVAAQLVTNRLRSVNV
jgi:hypothetical protein